MNWLAKGWTIACVEIDGLVSRSHWHSALQETGPSLVFNLLVQLQVKTHKELHYKPFWGRPNMGYREAGSALAADSAFCERNSSLIKGLCEWGVGSRERR